MKAVSLFAGVGGFDLALERNGAKVVATCEIDKHAQKILTRHFPNAQLFSDVTTLTGEDLFNVGFNSDGIIVGGFPDNWTDGQTDGHRYKQMGNAVAVPVVEFLVKRLMDHE